MFCPRCGKENDDTARYCQACGNGLQPAVTPSPATGVARYAAFWERFVAQVIDAVILSVATGTVFTATFGAGMAIGFFAPWLYEAFMTSSEWQATVGKRVLSIVVTDLNGNRHVIGPRAQKRIEPFQEGGQVGKDLPIEITELQEATQELLLERPSRRHERIQFLVAIDQDLDTAL